MNTARMVGNGDNVPIVVSFKISANGATDFNTDSITLNVVCIINYDG